ncbi:MAG: hypothetical protein VX992_07430 [Acidobacteriota bacterium]|nr:hypothetical protein [Acidobacteriota bacterium]
MFEYIKNKFKFSNQKITIPKRAVFDGIEKSLWDIKDVYDLETEEVEMIVDEKRVFQSIRNEGFKKQQ